MSRVIVTGSSGFIGHRLVPELERQGYEVRTLDLREDATTQADLRGAGVAQQALLGADAVIHLAGLDDRARALRDPEAAWSLNADMALHVLNGARVNAVPRVILASSALAVVSMDPLDASRCAAESLGAAFRVSYGLQVTNVRLACVYGPGDRRGPVGRWCRALLAGEPPRVQGGSQVRDFVHVDDAVAVLARLLPRPEPLHATVGSGQLTPVEGALEELREISGRGGAVDQVPLRPDDEQRPTGVYEEAARRALCTREELGLGPPIALHSGLQDTWDWFQRADIEAPPAPVDHREVLRCYRMDEARDTWRVEYRTGGSATRVWEGSPTVLERQLARLEARGATEEELAHARWLQLVIPAAGSGSA